MGPNLFSTVSPGGDDGGGLASEVRAFGRHFGALGGFTEGEGMPGEGI